MSDSTQTRSEQASPRKRQESRARGQVASSPDMAMGIAVLLSMILLSYIGPAIGNDLAAMFFRDLSNAASIREFSLTHASDLGWSSGLFIIRVLAGLLLGTTLFATAAHLGQIGFQLTPQAMEWKPSRLSPVQGAGRIFSLRGVMRTVMAALKFTACLSAMAVACYTTFGTAYPKGGDLGVAISDVWSEGMFVATMGGLSLVVVGLVDFAFQKWQHERDLRMSLQELKQETKESEGDAQIRARIKKLRSETVKQLSIRDVPSATVVITNPTHYAVAIRYQQNGSGAPVVVAKGKDHLALRIREVAKESGVPIYEKKDVARALYSSAEIGNEIPANLYRAVAEILVHIYGLRRRPGS